MQEEGELEGVDLIRELCCSSAGVVSCLFFATRTVENTRVRERFLKARLWIENGGGDG